MASAWRSDANEDEPWPIWGPVKIDGYLRWAWGCRWCDTGDHTESNTFQVQARADADSHVGDCPKKPAGFRLKESDHV